MIEIKEVSSKKEMRLFVDFPNRLFKGNPYYVPPMYADEMKLFTANPFKDVAKSVFFLAYEGKEVVGRISGILQYQHNEKTKEKRVRFTRIDAIDDFEVFKALFEAVEDWARKEGMDTVCGPLDYNDLGREGLLIEGFEELCTFEEQYQPPYYQKHIEALSYQKEVDWVEYSLRYNETTCARVRRMASFFKREGKFHLAPINLPKRKYIAKYRDDFFYCLDECYRKLYGTVPIDQASQDALIKQFIQVINKKYLRFVLNEEGKTIAFILVFPSLARVFQKAGGRLTLGALLRLFHDVRKPKIVDFGLIGVLPEYQETGVNAILMDAMVDVLENVESMETNLNLETNSEVQAQWKLFNARQHKRRRAYVKKLS